MTETFRLTKSVKYLGIVFTAIYLAAVLGFLSPLLLEDPAKQGFKGQHSVAIFVGIGVAVFGTMMLASIYIWLAYYVERFTVDGTLVSVRSMLQNRRFDVSDLRCLTWRVAPRAGSIRFQLPGSRARLDLYGYAPSDRLKIIRALRGLVAPDVQEGWPMFCQKVALPLRDGKAPALRNEPDTSFCLITRRRYDLVLIPALAISIAVTLALWAWLAVWQLIPLPIVVLGTWLWLRFSTPIEGRRELRVTSTDEGRAMCLSWSMLVGSSPLAVGLLLLGVDKPVTGWILCGLLLASLPPSVYLLGKADKRRRTAEQQGLALAQGLWQQGENPSGGTA